MVTNWCLISDIQDHIGSLYMKFPSRHLQGDLKAHGPTAVASDDLFFFDMAEWCTINGEVDNKWGGRAK